MNNPKQPDLIASALEESIANHISKVCLWPLSDLESKTNQRNPQFTLYRPNENPIRTLTLQFDPTMEVRFRQSDYPHECVRRIRNAVDRFWDGHNSQQHQTTIISDLA